MGALTTVYFNILVEFLNSGFVRLRLLPVSSGIFAGAYADQMPTLTAEALSRALGRLDHEHVQRLKQTDVSADLCIFSAADFADYCKAMPSARKADEAADDTFNLLRFCQ